MSLMNLEIQISFCMWDVLSCYFFKYVFYHLLLFFFWIPIIYSLIILMVCQRSHRLLSLFFIVFPLFSSDWILYNTCFLIHRFCLMFIQVCSWCSLLQFSFNSLCYSALEFLFSYCVISLLNFSLCVLFSWLYKSGNPDCLSVFCL